MVVRGAQLFPWRRHVAGQRVRASMADRGRVLSVVRGRGGGAGTGGRGGRFVSGMMMVMVMMVVMVVVVMMMMMMVVQKARLTGIGGVAVW